jgi:CheY-like chemotaxis protein
MMKKHRIVIVENDEDEQVFMKEGFKSADLFEVIAMFNNGNGLMEWLNSRTSDLPELVLSDLNMPGKNGYDIITEIKSNPRFEHIPVIITSTSSTKAFIEKCLAYGAAGYLVKPETFVEYVPFVHKLYDMVVGKELVK